MARHAVKGAEQLATALPADLVRRFREFVAARGSKIAHELADAIERHMAYPPPPKVPAPLPDSPATGEGNPADAENPPPARAKKRKA